MYRKLLLEASSSRIVGRIFIIKDGKVCIAKTKTHGFEIPGGALKKEETAQQAAEREALEEVGIAVKNVVPLDKETYILDYPMYGYDSFEIYTFKGDFKKYDRSLWLTNKGDKLIPVFVDIKTLKDKIRAELPALKDTSLTYKWRKYTLEMLKLL